jgi:hypothetical protein
MFRPSPPCAAATMPSADFCPFIPTSLDVGSRIGKQTDLPGYCAPTFPPYTRRIYSRPFRSHRPVGRMTIGLRAFVPPRPGAVASYALRVPRAGGLLTASFRPRLAAAALAVRLTVPVIRVRRGLAPPSECALPGAHEKAAGTQAPAAVVTPSLAPRGRGLLLAQGQGL